MNDHISFNEINRKMIDKDSQKILSKLIDENIEDPYLNQADNQINQYLTERKDKETEVSKSKELNYYGRA